MKITSTDLPGVLVLEPQVFNDARGFFQESYNQKTFIEAGLNYNFVQDNHSLSLDAGVIRGIHYQLNPKAQTKLVRVLAGAIFDVAVDIRQNSPTFGRWITVTLSAANKLQLLVPRGFAHGFCTLEPHTQVLYKVDEYYSPEHDRGISWEDPDLGISWPTKHPILSAKDLRHPTFKQAELTI
ncbi:dTDP-4-deoxyrhamnose-3,5-epimerase [Candidatus Desulfosporosinus infrequens]|uniref:dTDP-4-dehydrorhamnose 3,5-epimerase n=1 Tax=Candidatus Desulfosporosinus infrequens TaxID=2043169 RepID=A0A2U3LV85_9FIRM|nr:dTDP-4-deoxyrhamnose-3,5-epimerase [Candidatus Desulfosporosinus infrequens]